MVLQVVGLAGLVAFGVFWGLTDRLSPTLLAAAGSLVGVGTYVRALAALPDVRPADSGEARTERESSAA
jgi:hypothetical protein